MTLNADKPQKKVRMAESRIRIVKFSPDVILGMTRGTYKVVENPVPQDAVVRACFVEKGGQVLGIVISHPDFAIVPIGSEIPDHPAPVIQTIELETQPNGNDFFRRKEE